MPTIEHTFRSSKVTNWKGLPDVLARLADASDERSVILQEFQLTTEAEVITFDAPDDLLLYPSLQSVTDCSIVVHMGSASLFVTGHNWSGTHGTVRVQFGGLDQNTARKLIQFTKKSLGVEVTEQPEESAALPVNQGEPSAATSLATATEYLVAHEFAPAQIDDLRKAIDSALSGSGLTAYYADSELRQGHIFNDKILPKIRICRFGIYEISNPGRPNVFLELGAGLALGKSCIIICKRGTEVPADLGGIDRIEYQSYVDLVSQLKDKLKPYL